MNRTRLGVPRMDCAAEERLVRRAAERKPSIHRVDADLSVRTVDVDHDGPAESVLRLCGR